MKICLTEAEFRTYVQHLVEMFHMNHIKREKVDSPLIIGDLLRQKKMNNGEYRRQLDKLFILFDRRPNTDIAKDIIRGLYLLNSEGTLKKKHLDDAHITFLLNDKDTPGHPKWFDDDTFAEYERLYQIKLDYIEKFLIRLEQHPEIGIIPVIADSIDEWDKNLKSRAIYFINEKDYNENGDGDYFFSKRIGSINDDGAGALHFPVDVADLGQYGIRIPKKLAKMRGDNSEFSFNEKHHKYLTNDEAERLDKIDLANEKNIKKREAIEVANRKYSDYEVIPSKTVNANGIPYYGVMLEPSTERASLVRGTNDKRFINDRELWFDLYYNDGNNDFLCNYSEDGEHLIGYQIIVKNNNVILSKKSVQLLERKSRNFIF